LVRTAGRRSISLLGMSDRARQRRRQHALSWSVLLSLQLHCANSCGCHPVESRGNGSAWQPGRAVSGPIGLCIGLIPPAAGPLPLPMRAVAVCSHARRTISGRSAYVGKCGPLAKFCWGGATRCATKQPKITCNGRDACRTHAEDTTHEGRGTHGIRDARGTHWMHADDGGRRVRGTTAVRMCLVWKCTSDTVTSAGGNGGCVPARPRRRRAATGDGARAERMKRVGAGEHVGGHSLRSLLLPSSASFFFSFYFFFVRFSWHWSRLGDDDGVN